MSGRELTSPAGLPRLLYTLNEKSGILSRPQILSKLGQLVILYINDMVGSAMTFNKVGRKHTHIYVHVCIYKTHMQT